MALTIRTNKWWLVDTVDPTSTLTTYSEGGEPVLIPVLTHYCNSVSGAIFIMTGNNAGVASWEKITTTPL